MSSRLDIPLLFLCDLFTGHALEWSRLLVSPSELDGRATPWLPDAAL